MLRESALTDVEPRLLHTSHKLIVYEPSSTFSQWATMWMHVTRLLHTPITNTIATTINSTYMLLAATEVSFKRRYECVTTKWYDDVLYVRYMYCEMVLWHECVTNGIVRQRECVTMEWCDASALRPNGTLSESRRNCMMRVRHGKMVWCQCVTTEWCDNVIASRRNSAMMPACQVKSKR